MGLACSRMRRTLLTGIVLVLLLAAFLRFHRLEAQSFWNDEGNSARLSERSIALIIEGTASDIHPPLYYLLLRGWREVVGASEFSLRALSAFAGIGTVAATFALGKVVASRSLEGSGPPVVAPVAALLAAVNPALVYYSQEARMYSLLALLATLATLLLIRWWRATRSGRPGTGLAVAYVTCAAAGLYTHYFFPAVLLAHNLLVLILLIRELYQGQNHLLTRSPAHAGNRRLLTHWIGIMIATIVLYLPWLPIFLDQWGSDPPVRPPFLEFLAASGRWLAFGATVAPESVGWPLLIVALLLAWGVVAGRRGALIGAVALAVPVLLLFAAGLARPEFYKFLLIAVPPLCLLLALPLAQRTMAKAIWGARPLLSLFLLAVLWGSGHSLQNLYTNPAYVRADYRSMASRIRAAGHPNAGVILNAPNQWEVFTYYYPDESAVYPLPPGRQRPDPDVIDEQLGEIADRHDRLYAIFWGEAQRDPQRLVERWLDEHTFKATDEWVGDVRFVTYAVLPEAAEEMETAVDLKFGEHIQLKGYTLPDSDLAPGDIVPVTLFWETAAPLDQRYKVFLHLMDKTGQVVAQRDSEPGGNLALTTTWQVGQTIVDNHGILLPMTTAAGDYRVVVGLYSFADPGARLPISTEQGVVNAVTLATITISP